jgi:invasion protein IalB
MRKTRFAPRLLLGLLFFSGTAGATTLWPNLSSVSVSQLEELPKTSQPVNDPPAQASAPSAANQGWIARCMSNSRQSPVACSVEESLVMSNTGQPVASIVVQMLPKAHEPMMTIRVPVGLYIPPGLTMQIDDGKTESVSLLACDARGCFAQMSLNASAIASFKGGKKLSITFQNAAKANVTLPFPLENFADSYQKIQ